MSETMTTPIDTTLLRERTEAVRDAGVQLRALPWGTDAHREANAALCDAKARLYRDAPPDGIILALLDEVERLRAMIDEAGEGTFNVLALLDLYQRQSAEADERAALAYPRALQAAADVVLVAPAPAEVDEADWLAYQDDLANVILELSAEQIDACDAKVEEAAQVAEHYVCPGCHVVDEEPCLPGCIDAEIEGERRTPFDGFSEFMADDEGDESEEGGDHG